MVFQYYPCTIDQEMNTRTDKMEAFNDEEIVQILGESV